MFRALMGVAVILASPQALAAEPLRTCTIKGEVIQWVADYCMLKLGTDDEIAASDCIAEELKAVRSGECGAKAQFKRAMCSLVIARDLSRVTVEECVRDPAFMGRIVRRGGAGG